MIFQNLGWPDNGWEDLRVPLTSTKTGGTKDPTFQVFLDNGSGSQGVFAYSFSASQEQEVYFAIQMPHAWKQGTKIYPHVHWAGSTAQTTAQVCWGLEYSFVDINGVFSDTTLIYGDTTSEDDTDVAAYTHYMTNISNESTGGIVTTAITGVSAMMICRLFRNVAGDGGTDSYTSAASLFEFDIHYRSTRAGSANISGP